MGFSANAGNELHFHNRKSYFDSFKTFEVIDAEIPIVIFFWDIRYSKSWCVNEWLCRCSYFHAPTTMYVTYREWLHKKKIIIKNTIHTMSCVPIRRTTLLKQTSQFDQKSSQPGTCTILVKTLTRI